MKLALTKSLLCRALLSVSLAPASTWALPRDPTDDQVLADIDAGTFEDPSVNVRPRYRYWVPDAAVDLEAIADDVKEIGRIGASGMELLTYYLYGGPPAGWGTYAPVDWSVYGWGTKAWTKLFHAFAQATKDNGLIMDFAMGPNQGQGVPAEYDDEGKAWDLKMFRKNIPLNDTEFSGKIDGWGTGELEAVVVGGNPVGGPANVLHVDTLMDLTEFVSEDGHLEFEFQEPGKYNYIVWAVYLVHSHWQAQASPPLMDGPQSQPESWIQNGSWAFDHFSKRGAQMGAKFWEDHILQGDTLDLVKAVGNYAWEDSLELRQDYRWTREFAARFREEHRYNVKKFLPVVHFRMNTEQWDQGERYRMDYRTTLATLYGEYLEEWTRWANEYLNIQFSCQVSYGVWMDALASVPKVNAPEDESLIFSTGGFHHNIDRYRQYTGPANLAGKRVISNELGADIYKGFQQTLPELLDIFKLVIAGGNNQAVIHGAAYTGAYPNTTWPGVATFGYQFADYHSKWQPAWDDYKEFMDVMARYQMIFQTGIPRRDVILHSKRFWYVNNASYVATDMRDMGFSYEYLSPDNFELPEAFVEDEVFAPNRQAARAIVVRVWEHMTLFGARKLREYALAGLPIIFAGGVPTRMWAAHTCPADVVEGIMNEIAELPNVHVAATNDDGVAQALVDIGIVPRTRIDSNGPWYTAWREDTANDVDYVYVYNPTNRTTEGTVDFETTKIPYIFDAWTGEKNPVVQYQQTDERTIIPFTLHGNQSTIVAFLPEPLAAIPSVHVTEASGDILSITADEKKVSVKAGASSSSSSSSVKTSDGKAHAIPKSSAQPFSPSSWSLTVEHWDPPSDLYDYPRSAIKSNSTHALTSLRSWLTIPGLENTSGRGHYRTTFTWPPSSDADADGALLDLGRTFHSMKAYVNGKKLPPLDCSAAVADIGPYLRDGENVLEVTVGTTLINVLRPIWRDLRFSATHPSESVPVHPAQNYGLAGPVVLTPYRETLI